MTDENVIDIGAHGKKKGRGKKSDGDNEPSGVSNDKASAYVRNFYWQQIIDNSGMELPANTNVDPIDVGHAYYVWEPVPGVRHVLRGNCVDQTAQVVKDEALVNACLAASHHKLSPASTALALGPESAKQAVAYWKATTNTRLLEQEPISVAWANEPSLAYHRMPWDFKPDQAEGACPTWDVLFSRMSNAHACKCFIGSLLDGRAAHQQYVWVYGAGQDGKGCMARFLQRAFGHAFASKQPPNQSNERFWASGLIGKRICVLPDCSDKKFIKSGLFKSLTGRDPMEIEPKGQPSYTASLKAMFMVLSNELPDISNRKSDQRRIILCSFEERTDTDKVDPTFEERLWAEGGPFLSNCLALYRETCPQHGPIPAEMDAAIDLADENELLYEAMLECFNYEHPGPPIASPSIPRHPKTALWLVDTEVRRALVANRYNKYEIAGFLRWIQQSRGVRRSSRLENGKKTNVYAGLLFKNMLGDERQGSDHF